MAQEASIAIVGAGPRGIEVLERVIANHTEFLAADVPLTIHMIDPFPPGGGKVWRFDQSPLLRLNSMAMDVTLFTDPSVRCDGPIRPGPSLAEWARIVPRDELPTVALRHEADELVPISFPTRRLGGEYLAWVYRHVVGNAMPSVRVVHHAATVVDVIGRDDETQIVVLESNAEMGGATGSTTGDDPCGVGCSIDADVVVLTLGHLDIEPDGEAARLDHDASRHHLTYLPPSYGTEADLSVFGPGDDVIVRGFGLGFVDLLVLLTEGRGGRFVELGDGRLRYEPSGTEPRFHIGSRRGVPYRSKITYERRGAEPALPRFFTRAAIEALLAAHEVVNFRTHAWPLLAKEIAWAFYHELATGHPERIRGGWSEFDAALEAVDWGTGAWNDTVARFVPSVADRIDFDALDRPLDGLRFDDIEDLQRHMRGYIRDDLARRADPAFSADLGAFNAFLAVFANLPLVLGSHRLSAVSRVQDFDDWWFGFFSYYASGPPPRRMEELLALSEAGVVRFLGADMWLSTDDGLFVAGAATTPATVTARSLIDARLPGPSVSASASPLVQALATRGEIAELVLTEPDGTRVGTGQMRVSNPDQHVIDADGCCHPRRFAVGPHSTSKAPAFVRPNTNAIALRHNDACARALLATLARITVAREADDNEEAVA